MRRPDAARPAVGRSVRLRRLANPRRVPGGKKQPKVVALGGGMGLSASLTSLRRITGDHPDQREYDDQNEKHSRHGHQDALQNIAVHARRRSM